MLQQLEDLVTLLSESPERPKADFQRLALRVTMTPMIDAAIARPLYRADVVNSLPCLAGIGKAPRSREAMGANSGPVFEDFGFTPRQLV